MVMSCWLGPYHLSFVRSLNNNFGWMVDAFSRNKKWVGKLLIPSNKRFLFKNGYTCMYMHQKEKIRSKTYSVSNREKDGDAEILHWSSGNLSPMILCQTENLQVLFVTSIPCLNSRRKGHHNIFSCFIISTILEDS